MAFSSPRAAQLNQREAFRTGKGSWEMFAARVGYFFLADIAGQAQGEVLFSGLSQLLQSTEAAGVLCCFCKLAGTEACGPQSVRCDLTFNKTGCSHVAMADYSDAAGDRGGKEVCMMARLDGEMESNKAGILPDLPLTDPVCLCEFMATV